MKLMLKFNLVFGAVFLVGLLVTGIVMRELLARNAQDEVLQHARFMMEKASAVRSYTASQIAPLLQDQMQQHFLPQSVPAFAAVEVLGKLQKVYPDYSYREATLNPTNPRDRAVDWEADLIAEFKKAAAQKEFVGQRETPNGRTLYVARPIRISDPACLRCHSTVEAAPQPMVAKYGPANGFGWQVDEIVGTQLVSVPMAVPLARARGAWLVFMGLLTGVFVAIALALNGLLWWLVVRPVTELSDLADRVSRGDPTAPGFNSTTGFGDDEIGVLSRSFVRMRKSLVQAMKMLTAAPER
jgi:protein-histidine pros-kinase